MSQVACKGCRGQRENFPAFEAGTEDWLLVYPIGKYLRVRTCATLAGQELLPLALEYECIRFPSGHFCLHRFTPVLQNSEQENILDLGTRAGFKPLDQLLHLDPVLKEILS